VIVKIIIGSRTVGTTGDVGAGVVVVVKVWHWIGWTPLLQINSLGKSLASLDPMIYVSCNDGGDSHLAWNLKLK
jgi:hypothetical protein